MKAAEVLVVCLSATTGFLWFGDTAPPVPPVPVVFVHGCPPAPPVCIGAAGKPCTNEEESRLFTRMIDDFRGRGYDDTRLRRFVASGPPCDSIVTQAADLATFVDGVRAATGAPTVDIVAHSMGALTARLYVQQHGAAVRRVVSIGGGNHGSELGKEGAAWQVRFGAPAYQGAREMAPPYDCGDASAPAGVQARLNGCLTAEGRRVTVDETPGSARYLSIWNTVDDSILPPHSACLDQQRQGDCSSSPVNVAVTVRPGPGPCGPQGCPGHVTMLWDPGVMKLAGDFLCGPGGCSEPRPPL